MTTPPESARYDRQVILPEIGHAGQTRLAHSRVLVVGAGGLGSPASLYLAAAGVGTIGILDSDRVEPSNLHRQVLHGTHDVGREKTTSAAETLRALNPGIRVVPHPVRLDAANAPAIIGDYDLVVDGSDNFATRYAVNDACVVLGVPWVYGSVERFSGQLAFFDSRSGPCYRCIFPDRPAPGTTPSCEDIGVLGAVPGVIGAMQATEALKYLVGAGDTLTGKLLQLDFLRWESRTIRFDKRPDCAACSRSAPRNEEASAMTKDSAALPPFDIEPGEVRERLRAAPAARLLDVREPWELQRASISDAIAIPMSRLEEQLESLDATEEIIVFCHHGGRSRTVTDWLRSQGYRARNMSGGIDRWSREIDPSVPRY